MYTVAKILAGEGPQYPQVVVLVGATGDLARRKLWPGLFHLASAGFIPGCRIIGVSLEDLDVEGLRAFVRSALDEFSSRKVSAAAWDAFAKNLDYVPLAAGAATLKAAVEKAEQAFGGESRRLHYLSVPPNAALSAVRLLGEAGLVERSRIIMEKPFGTDLASAVSLNARLHEVFSEDQIFRIDHFLGKEPAQNILAFRFANGLFEPIWNRNFIDHVQIDVPETLGLGRRSAFYEQTGAYRDMVVTHLFQVLGFLAMEPPVSLAARHLRDEKLKVYDALKPIDVRHVVRGQYDGYTKSPGVPADSDTETMIALRVEIENWRWRGVPFYLRSGKSMKASRQVITLGFQEPALRMFHAHRKDVPAGRTNEIVIDFADPGSINIDFMAKMPGPEMTLGASTMSFRYADSFAQSNALEGYERLILLAMLGDMSLFTSSDGIERVWEISEPLLTSPPPVEPYEPGTWGPASVDKLIAPYHWHLR
jgi:glucose-6-phosphate 1-dehydrogenase